MLHAQIENDLIAALKSGEKEKAGVLRFLISAIKNFQIEKKAQGQKHLPDGDIISVLRRQAKQRKDSIAEYGKGGRADLVEKESKELEILESYLPEELSEAQIREVVEKKIGEFGISGKAEFGKLMGAVMKEFSGNADGDKVKKIVEEEIEKI
jgi:uncharacterized protein